MDKKDTKYWINGFTDDTIRETYQYKYFHDTIESEGEVKMIANKHPLKVYTAELSYILHYDFTAENTNTKEEVNINHWEYLETYLEAFKEGEAYFVNEFKKNPLYNGNADCYVNDIHEHFFHTQLPEGFKGWGFVKNNHPLTLTHQQIKKFGYYSGIVSKVYEEIDRSPKIFKKFENCDHDKEPQQNKIEKLSDLITHEKSNIIVEKLKIQYKNIHGKNLKLLLLALQQLELIPKVRIGSKFYEFCKNEFNWDISTYNAVNGYKYNERIDSEELDSMKSFLKTIIKDK